MENKNIQEFDKHYHNIIMQARGGAFGRMMTIIDTLDLPEKQLKAIKSLIARDTDEVFLDILDKRLMETLLEHFGYQRDFDDSVKEIG